MEELRFSETSVFASATRRNIPENAILHDSVTLGPSQMPYDPTWARTNAAAVEGGRLNADTHNPALTAALYFCPVVQIVRIYSTYLRDVPIRH
jgi:hypothetical protein